MMQAAVEVEVDEFFGRVRYQRRDDDHPAGWRNGWQPPAMVKTTRGAVELQRPKLRGTDEAFCSLFLDGSHFKMHPGAPGRAGVGRLGHRHRRPPGVRGPGPGRLGVDRRLG
jgi:hypothetical protein